MHLEDLDPALLRRSADRNVPVEAAWAQQRGVENIRPVRGCEYDHEIGLRKAIHLAQNLIERLLTFVVTAAQSRAALPADGVDFVDENDGRRVFLRCPKQIADAAGANAHKHL